MRFTKVFSDISVNLPGRERKGGGRGGEEVEVEEEEEEAGRNEWEERILYHPDYLVSLER